MMSFIGHSTMRRGTPEASDENKTATVKVWGEAKDAVQVDGPLDGCKPYSSTDLGLKLSGPGGELRLRVFFENEKWRITLGHGEHKEVLSATVGGGQGATTVMATIEEVQVVETVEPVRVKGKK